MKESVKATLEPLLDQIYAMDDPIAGAEHARNVLAVCAGMLDCLVGTYQHAGLIDKASVWALICESLDS